MKEDKRSFLRRLESSTKRDSNRSVLMIQVAQTAIEGWEDGTVVTDNHHIISILLREKSRLTLKLSSWLLNI